MRALYITWFCALVADFSTFLGASRMRAFLWAWSLTRRALFTAFVLAFMVADDQSTAILFTFSVKVLLEAVAAFVLALMITF